MARNKHPEETIKKILDVSFSLFEKKGYDHTTVQDIVNALKMSKGAVYHHFKSKEDILDKISERYCEVNGGFAETLSNSALNGLEKLRCILYNQLSDENKLSIDRITASSCSNNPRFLALTLNSTMTVASDFLCGIIEEGIADGSIKTDKPRELTEVFLLLTNIWVGLYSKGKEDFINKLRFLKTLMDAMGLPIIDEELFNVAEKYHDMIIYKYTP